MSGARVCSVTRSSTCRHPSDSAAAIAARTAPNAARRAHRNPLTCSRSSAGTFKLRTDRGGASASTSSTSSAIVAAVSQRHGSPAATLTARPFAPKFWAVSAAPTVPECKIARPVLRPALIPDSTSSGGGPNAPSRPASAHNPGGPTSAHAGASQPRICTRRTSIWESAWNKPIAAPLPLASAFGATTTTSWPAATTWRARTCRPCASMPSSFVTRIRTRRT